MARFLYFLLYFVLQRQDTELNTKHCETAPFQHTSAAPRRPAPPAPPQRSRPSWWHWVLEHLRELGSVDEPAEAAPGSSLEELHDARCGEELQHLLF